MHQYLCCISSGTRNRRKQSSCFVGLELNFLFFWQEGPFNLLVMRIGALKKAGAYRQSGNLSISGFLGVR